MKIIISALFIFYAALGFSRSLTTEQKLSDLNELVGVIKTGYGPLVYKKEKFGIDIDKLVTEYTKKITETKNNSEFYYEMVKFVAEFNDSHFGARVPSEHKGSLGFRADYVDNKFVIDTIDREIASEEDFPFERGDEIVSFNEEPVLKEVEKIYPFMGQGTKLTAMRKAASFIGFRHGSITPVIEGKVKLVIKKGSSDFTEEVEREWVLSGDHLDEFIPGPKTETTKSITRSSSVNYNDISLNIEPAFEKEFRCSGETRTHIPKDATIIMKKPFVAYYHKTEKGNIGYLRIPHYSPSEENKEINAYDLRFSQYEYAVSELEKNTVGLVIDQDHNCGGSVSYLHRIVSLFAKKAFAPMQFELLATKANFFNFKKWVNETQEYTIQYQNFLKVIELIKNTWQNGSSHLTTKTQIGGKVKYQPNHIRYTKPIVILIDELSGSGGDGFPAMMQGIGRAKLIGTQTMGAGGHVESIPPLSHSYIKVRITKSLFYHPNNIAIENNGATPDIAYRPTLNDYIYEYRGYQKFYINELHKLIK